MLPVGRASLLGCALLVAGCGEDEDLTYYFEAKPYGVPTCDIADPSSRAGVSSGLHPPDRRGDQRAADRWPGTTVALASPSSPIARPP